MSTAAELKGPFVLERLGCSLHYWTAGEPGRPWVTLTHGFSMDHRMFDKQVAALSQQWRVLVWDMRGQGLSKPLGVGFSVPLAAQDLLALQGALAINEAAHVGHSLGGYVAQEIEFRYATRVSALALISSTCLTFRQPLALSLGAPLTRVALRWSPEDWYHRRVGSIAGTKPETQAYAEQASRRLSREDREAIWAGVLRSYHHEPGYRIRVPLLLLHGQYDYQVGFGLIRLLAERWIQRETGCRHAIVPAAGHNANQDNPGFVNEELVRFFESTKRPRAE